MSLEPPVIKPSDMAAYEARPMVDGRKICEHRTVSFRRVKT